MYKKKKPSDEGGQAGGPVAFPRLVDPGDLAALRNLVHVGGGCRFVRHPRVGGVALRRLRIAGLVDLLESVDGSALAKLTSDGVKALANAPQGRAR